MLTMCLENHTWNAQKSLNGSGQQCKTNHAAENQQNKPITYRSVSNKCLRDRSEHSRSQQTIPSESTPISDFSGLNRIFRPSLIDLTFKSQHLPNSITDRVIMCSPCQNMWRRQTNDRPVKMTSAYIDQRNWTEDGHAHTNVLQSKLEVIPIHFCSVLMPMVSFTTVFVLHEFCAIL